MPIAQATRPAELPEVAPQPLNPRATIGGNKPPLSELIPAEFKAQLLEHRPDFLQRFEDLVGAAERAVATNDDELARCGDLVKAYRKLIAHIDQTHETVKAPHLEAGRLVDQEKKSLRTQVDAAKAKVERIGHAYVADRDAKAKAERDRIAREQREAAEAAERAEREAREAEEAAQRAAEEAASADDAEKAKAAEIAKGIADAAAIAAHNAMQSAALAPAEPTKAEPVRSDAGATVSGKQEWLCEVEDYGKALKAVKSDPKVKEAIDAAIKRLVRAGQREIAGVRIWPVAKANFR